MKSRGSRKLGSLVADLAERLEGVGGVAAGAAAALSACEITGLAYRSDAVQPGNLFFCVPGIKADGHDFATDAAARGAAVLAVERPVPVDLPQLRFDDTRLALALISRDFYDNPSCDMAITAVTGTNGKTTTTYLIDWICRYAFAQRAALPLEDASRRTGLIGTVETRVGSARLPSKFTTPESLDLQRLLAQMRDEGVSHVCMEASSHAIALKRVAGVSFMAAAFSNLTQDHLDFHGSMEEYFEAKAALFDSPLVARRVINIDTTYGQRLASRCEKAGFGVVTCGFSPEAQISVDKVDYQADGTSLVLITPEGDFPLSYPLIGGFNVSNILLAAATASVLGFSWEEIQGALALSPQIPGRLERVSAQGLAADDPQQPPLGVFVDYSHTPDSIVKALNALEEIKRARTLIVFGCGGDRDATKRPLMGAAALAADYAIVTSDNPRTEDPLSIIDDILPGMKGGEGRYEVEPSRRAAIARALAAAEPGDLVLIAGKGHEDYQLVGDKVLDFDDRVVAAEELRALVDAGRWGNAAATEGATAPLAGHAGSVPKPTTEDTSCN
ncbi:MAG: UDP-N-acetylmuramoyl-L-alanyl-D-glutamate--2,6-diaminopimelate ligase [Coriobacteriales bacterium]|jgi:UDP-N-acetylmuramoyl-L-alanyl-D-glutamate--2,6-diaminopimelate ligase|nr:UDP-N-acetylmuramoyl-L-alanyl-D-glutamate--2,6-diaminopimelate ligase [Coriobacteriales bacterium]